MAVVRRGTPRRRNPRAAAARARHAWGAWAALACLAILWLAPAPVTAQELPPALTEPVNDFAGIVDGATRAELDRRIRALQTATGDVVAVATVKTIHPYGTIEEYAVKMFENHGRGIGQKGRDNGALLVVAVDDRRVRIEVGYELEEFITDGYAGEIIRTSLRPAFQRGDYGAGILEAATRIINRVAERRGVRLEDVPEQAPRPVSNPSFNLPVGPIIFIIIMLILMNRGGGRRRRRRYWGGGPWSGWNSGVGPFGGGLGGGFGGFGGGSRGGGGFGGFGGGRSGGGGASGGW